ncbi:RNase H-like domain found in reverse transcriptase [Popillia japonica]|uniref:RNA-directed DNA polymerase n=1 Tax=Popillia japonica TaxID=7064 RepID=A0AAW1HWE0_POPJA
MPAETKYSSYGLEVLAITQAVRKFRIYLLGTEFKIITDCSAFQRTIDKKDLTTRVARWALLLEEYNFKIEHQDYHIKNKVSTRREKQEFILTIKRILEQNAEYDNYFMETDLLYKYDDGKELLVVQKAMQSEIIRRAHEEGHFAVKQTEELVKRDFFIPKPPPKPPVSMQETSAPEPSTSTVNTLLHIPTTNLPKPPVSMQETSAPEPSTSTVNNHSVQQNEYSAVFLSTAIIDVYDFKGKPQSCRVLLDSGSQSNFIAKKFVEKLGIRGEPFHIPVVGINQGNTQIKTMWQHVQRIKQGFWKRWKGEYLSHLQQRTPRERWISISFNELSDMMINEVIDEEIRREFSESREELRKNCKEQIFKVQEENTKGYNLRRKKS